MPPRTRSRRAPTLAAALLLSLVVAGCADDPETLSHVEVSASVSDPETSQSTTVHGYVPDLAVPAGTTLAEPLDDPVLVAVDVTVAIGADRSFSVRPSDFLLKTSSGTSAPALTSVNRALEDESLWPLLEVGSGIERVHRMALAASMAAIGFALGTAVHGQARGGDRRR